MKLALKNVKHSEFASHETDCFQASLYVDGKRFAFVWNDGQGGSNYYDYEDGVSQQDRDKLDQHVAEMLPREFMGDAMYWDLDQVVWELLQDWIITKDIKRYMKHKIVFMKPKDKVIWTATVRDKQPNAHLARFMEKNPTYLVLNAFPIAEAVERLKAWA